MENKLNWLNEIKSNFTTMNQKLDSLVLKVDDLSQRVSKMEEFAEGFAKFKSEQNEHRAKFEKVIAEMLRRHSHKVVLPSYWAITSATWIEYETDTPVQCNGREHMNVTAEQK
jgi:hypothetical protein